MQQRYPNAEIYCMSLMTRRYPVYSKADVAQPTEFNAKLREVIDTMGCSYIELEGLFTSDPADFDLYMGDKRVHPNALGMDLMTNAVVSAMLGRQTEICTVSYSLNGVKSSTSAATALVGGGYSAVLSAADGKSDLAVTVLMDGSDVTASCYQDGNISIPDVTGSIEIIASAVKAPANYRWELSGNALVSTGESENSLKLLEGSVSKGIQNSTRYDLAEDIVLKHDLPWVIEWNAGGDWSGMLLTSSTQKAVTGMEFIFRTYNTTGLLALGYYTGSQYNNYGIPLAELKLDMAQNHTYRMENRIANDGSNMVYLLIDGVEIDALNHYYIGGTKDQNQIVNWVNGQDFTFGYIGSTSHPLKNMSLQYLEVLEGGVQTPAPIIISQPEDVETALGDQFRICVESEGDGLTYQWYYKDASMKEFAVSSNRTSAYSYKMQSYMHNRQVYCVITDQYGNQIVTDTAVITRPPMELKVLTQPQDVTASVGEKFSIKPTV